MALSTQEAVTRFKESEERAHIPINAPGNVADANPARKARQAPSSARYIDYTIGAYDASGLVRIEYSAIGHPRMDRLVNPVINILAHAGYTHTIAARSLSGFDVVLYRPDGTPGVDASERIYCGGFECGDGTQCGQQGNPMVSLIVSIPVPLMEPPVPPAPESAALR